MPVRDLRVRAGADPGAARGPGTRFVGGDLTQEQGDQSRREASFSDDRRFFCVPLPTMGFRCESDELSPLLELSA